MKTKIYMGLITIGICCCLFTIIRKNKSSEITFTENKLYNTTLQNQNPYSIFGSDGILLTTEYERKREYKLDITNKDKTSSLTKLELDTQTGIATLFDKNGKILTQKQLDTKEKARWLSVDPLSEKYYDLSPYNYCGNSPLRYVDLTGTEMAEYIEVTINSNGTYTVVQGTADSDKNIYIINKEGERTGKIVGEMLTEYSFHDEDGNAITGVIIDPNDNSGQDFMDNEIIEKNPNLFHYMPNALGGKKYDFKKKGIKRGEQSYNNPQYLYRGMPFNDKIASARDIGNYAAGYMAGRNGFNWIYTRSAFDMLESSQNNWRLKIEGRPSRRAQRLGYNAGYLKYRQ